MRTVVASLFVLLALAGCVEDQATEQPEDIARIDTDPLAAARQPDVPLVFPFDAEGCTAGGIGILAPFEETDAHLPPGFHSADAMLLALPAMPAGLGQSAYLVLQVTCAGTTLDPAGSSFLSVSVFVDGPAVPGERQGARFDFYEVHRYAQDDGLGALLQAIQWPHETFVGAQGDVVYHYSDAPDYSGIGLRPALMEGAAHTDDAAVFSYTAVAASHYLTKDEIIRFWTTLPGGYGVMEIVPGYYGSGGTATCSIGAGTTLHDIVGQDACETADTVSALFPEQSWRGSFQRILR